jgi:hypothetical protein
LELRNEDAKKAEEALLKYKALLDDGKSVRTAVVTDEEKEHIADLFLLTSKTILEMEILQYIYRALLLNNIYVL